MKLKSVPVGSTTICAVLLTAVLLAGCADSDSSTDSATTDSAAITVAAPGGIHSWTLTSLTHGAKSVPLGETSPSIQFRTRQRVNAYAGCNHIDGQMTLQEDGRIATGEFGMTEMACLGPAMDIEVAYFMVLSAATQFEVKDGVLTMSDGSLDNQLVFKATDKKATDKKATDKKATDKKATDKQIKPVPDDQLGDPDETVSNAAEADTLTIENTEQEPAE